MKELIIYDFQAKDILRTLELASRVLNCKSKETSLDRDIIQSIETLKNVLNETPQTIVSRF
jgi:hypothetical protein